MSESSSFFYAEIYDDIQECNDSCFFKIKYGGQCYRKINKCLYFLKEYKKGNSIELKSQKGIEFLQNKKII